LTTRERTLTAGNVHEAAALLRRGLSTAALAGCDPVAACRSLLDAGSMMGALIDRIGAEGASDTIAIGAGTFVSNRVAAALRQAPQPGLSERVIRSQLTSEPLVLTRREIEHANATEGVSLVVVLHHWADALPETVEFEVRRHLMTGFLRDVKGYRLQEVLTETTESELQWALGGGFRVRSEYADWYAAHRDPLPRMILVGMARDEVDMSEGSLMSLVFDYTPPRFGFTPSQRKLLLQAIQHKTDAQIAAALGVSLSAVKKTWSAVFDKVSDVADIEGLRDQIPPSSPTRGAQKRHRLLTYLQNHLEELKP